VARFVHIGKLHRGANRLLHERASSRLGCSLPPSTMGASWPPVPHWLRIRKRRLAGRGGPQRHVHCTVPGIRHSTQLSRQSSSAVRGGHLSKRPAPGGSGRSLLMMCRSGPAADTRPCGPSTGKIRVSGLAHTALDQTPDSVFPEVFPFALLFPTGLSYGDPRPHPWIGTPWASGFRSARQRPQNKKSSGRQHRPTTLEREIRVGPSTRRRRCSCQRERPSFPSINGIVSGWTHQAALRWASLAVLTHSCFHTPLGILLAQKIESTSRTLSIQFS